MSLDHLRKQIKDLKLEREKATLEKGLAAEDNKDLRENFAYDYWVEREMLLTARIRVLIKEIERLTNKGESKDASKKSTKKSPPIIKIKDLPQNKWI